MPELSKIGPPSGLEVAQPARVQGIGSPAAAAAEQGLSGLNDKLMYLGRVWNHSDVVTGTLQGSGEFHEGIAKLQDDMDAQHPEYTPQQRYDALKQQSRKLRDTVIANHPIAQDNLTAHLGDSQLAFEDRLRNQYHIAREQQAKSDWELASDSQVRAALATDDPGQQRLHLLELDSAIKGSPLFAGDPAAQRNELIKVQTKIADGLMAKQISTAPHLALLQLSDPDFLKKNPLISAEKQMAFHDAAAHSLSQGLRDANDELEARRAPLLRDAIDKATSGRFTSADAIRLYQNGVDPSTIKNLQPGFVTPLETRPANTQLVKSYRDAIDTNGPDSVSETELISAFQGDPMGLRLANSYRQEQAAKIKIPLERLKKKIVDDVLLAKLPKNDLIDINPAATEAKRQQFKDDIELELSDAKNFEQALATKKRWIEAPAKEEPRPVLPDAVLKPLPGETEKDRKTRLGKMLRDMGYTL